MPQDERRMKETATPEQAKPSYRTSLKRHICVTFLAVGIMGFFAAVTVLAQPLDPIRRAISDFSFTDIYYEIQNTTSAPDTSRIITIVDLTKLTDRADIAQTIRDIEAGHPKVVGMDACFDNEGEDIDGNAELLDAVSSYDNIVFARKMLDWSGNDSIGWTKDIRSFFTEGVEVKEGTVNMPRGLYDSMKRRVPLCEMMQGKQYPSLVAQVANMYAGEDIIKDRTEDLNINFSPTRFRVLQPEDVAKHPEMVEDQIVMFGAMYEDADMHWTPLGKIAGVELLAYGVQSVVLSKEIKLVEFFPTCLISLLVIFIVQVVQTVYLRKTDGSKNMFVKYVVGSTYVMNILTFLCTSIFIGISFLIFKKCNVSFNLAWALSVIAFLGTSRSMYTSIKDYIVSVQDKYKFLRGIKL